METLSPSLKMPRSPAGVVMIGGLLTRRTRKEKARVDWRPSRSVACTVKVQSRSTAMAGAGPVIAPVAASRTTPGGSEPATTS